MNCSAPVVVTRGQSGRCSIAANSQTRTLPSLVAAIVWPVGWIANASNRPGSLAYGSGCATKCADGKNCSSSVDCASGVCLNDVCRKPTRKDGVKNGSETDIDCGSTCDSAICFLNVGPFCANGKICTTNDDCESYSCVGGTCAATTCSNNIEDGTESDIDCGGSCQNCLAGQQCEASDKNCFGATCNLLNQCAATCSSFHEDGTETDIDCGGSCSGCANGRQCVVSADCDSGFCVDGVCCNSSCTGACNACSATVKGNGVDGVCGPIELGDDPASECSGTYQCGGSGACQSCGDGIKDGAETDVDCGGGTCSKCGVARRCLASTDCVLGSTCLGTSGKLFCQ